MTIRHAIVPSTLGDLLIVADGDALSGLYFDGHRHPPSADLLGDRVDAGDDSLLARAEQEILEYLSGQRRAFEVPVTASGTELQQNVWEKLRDIPYGETVSYGELAEELGDPNLARAIGSAVGRNRISIVVPCHRVVSSTGKLIGYAGGADRKQMLLDLETRVAGKAAPLF